MNENAPPRSRIPANNSRFLVNWWAVHTFNGAKFNETNKKHENSDRIN